MPLRQLKQKGAPPGGQETSLAPAPRVGAPPREGPGSLCPGLPAADSTMCLQSARGLREPLEGPGLAISRMWALPTETRSPVLRLQGLSPRSPFSAALCSKFILGGLSDGPRWGLRLRWAAGRRLARQFLQGGSCYRRGSLSQRDVDALSFFKDCIYLFI